MARLRMYSHAPRVCTHVCMRTDCEQVCGHECAAQVHGMRVLFCIFFYFRSMPTANSEVTI